MESKQKQVAYTTTNTYETLNTLTQSTKNVWLVFHGIGYLSRYFLKYFNVTTYLDAVFAAENIPQNCNFIIFAFSQGVSIATRWLAHKQLKCNQLILYAGGIPNELKPIHFRFLEENKTKIKVIVGNQDEYLNEERIKFEVEKMKNLFNNKAELLTFEGGHEVKKELINNLV